MNLILGIDAGATRTRAWLAQLDGTIVACGEAAGANVHVLGVDASRRVIAAATAKAWRAAKRPAGRPRGFSAVFAGVAGAGAKQDQLALASALAAEFGVASAVCAADHDLRIALTGASPGVPGAVIVAGTGSACYGRSLDGREWKAGGWGPVLDDGGSGHWIGAQGMRAIIRAADGRAENPSFAAAVMAQLGAETPRALLEIVRVASGKRGDRATIAALAPLVLAAAAAGDAVATEIISRGVEELAAMAAAVWRALDLDTARDARLTGVGGLLEQNVYYREKTNAAVAGKIRGAKLLSADMPPAAGAVMLALELAGVASVGVVVARIRESLAQAEKK